MKLGFIKKIEFKIASIIMLAFAALIFFTSFYMYTKFADFMKQQAVSNAMQITEQLNLSLDNYIKQISAISISVYTDESINSILENPDKIENDIDTDRKMESYFNNTIANRPEISGIAFSLKSGSVFFSNTPEFKDIDFNFDYRTWGDFFRRFKAESIALLPPPKGKSSSSNYFILVKELQTFQTREVFGYMIFFLKNNFVDSILNNMYLNKSGRLFILDSEYNIILGDSKYYGENVGNALGNASFSNMSGTVFLGKAGDQKLISYNKSDYIGCTILGVFELNQLMSGSTILNNINSITIIIALILSLMISIIITAAFSKEINKITKKLQRMGNGEADVDFRSNRKDEIGKISNAISSMLENIKEMSEKQLESVKRSKEAVIKVREAEFAALQNQINPHFLYNALDSIRMKALINNDKEVSQMVGVLARLFRISINKGNNIVQVREEIEHVRCYLEVQKFRFGDKFKVIFDIDEKVLEYKVIKLILQPIVENAIVHGLEPKLEGGYVKIAAKTENAELIFDISDDGMGITEDNLEKISQVLDTSDAITESIGLYNVNHRIKHYYGEAFGLTINSELDRGTTVSIRLPYRENML